MQAPDDLRFGGFVDGRWNGVIGQLVRKVGARSPRWVVVVHDVCRHRCAAAGDRYGRGGLLHDARPLAGRRLHDAHLFGRHRHPDPVPAGEGQNVGLVRGLPRRRVAVDHRLGRLRVGRLLDPAAPVATPQLVDPLHLRRPHASK